MLDTRKIKAVSIDLDHDRDSRARGDKIACDMLALWGSDGLVEKMFKPIELWQAQCAGSVAGECMPAGHFIPEQLHLETAQALLHSRIHDVHNKTAGAPLAGQVERAHQ